MAGAGGAALGASLLFAPAANADTFPVNELGDSGDAVCDDTCTLRDAVGDANETAAADVVTFETGLSGEIEINDDISITHGSLEIQGPGAGQITVSGEDADRIFKIFGFAEPGEDVVISGLTLANGRTGGFGGAIRSYGEGGPSPFVEPAALTIADSVLTGNEGSRGGAVAAFYGSLNVTNSVITDNVSSGAGGGIYSDSANANGSETGGVTISNSIVSGNEAGGYGGGIRVVNAYGDTVVENTTVADNSSDAGGGGLALYGSEDGATTTIRASTISGNSGASGGGIHAAGTYTPDIGDPGPTLIENTTISSNEAAYYGGGVWSYNSNDVERTIQNSTITGNAAGTGASASDDDPGGGVFANLRDNPGSGAGTGGADEDNLLLRSTIVADNTPEDLATIDDLEGSFVLGFDLVQNPENAEVTESPAGSNLFGVGPQLGALANNGGPTQTHLPAATSPVIDKGIANGLTTDQRGQPRTFDAVAVANAAGGDGTDIGSVEVQPGEGGLPGNAQCQGATVPEFKGTEGDDTLTGTTGPDFLRGLGGADTASGAAGKDCVNGDEGRDRVSGGPGKDIVKGGGGKDRAKGNGGADKVKGNAGKDALNGGGGKDKLSGAGGKDRLSGGGGKDRLKGGPGKDKLVGGGGKDRINCGGGKDKVTAQAKDKVSGNCEKVVERG